MHADCFAGNIVTAEKSSKCPWMLRGKGSRRRKKIPPPKKKKVFILDYTCLLPCASMFESRGRTHICKSNKTTVRLTGWGGVTSVHTVSQFQKNFFLFLVGRTHTHAITYIRLAWPIGPFYLGTKTLC